MNAKSFPLYAAIVIGGLALLTSVSGLDIPVLRVLIGLPLVLILPGYALLNAVSPQWPERSVERITIGVGVSLAFTALVGMVLHLSPWGLSAATWGITLGSVTVIAGLIAKIRRKHVVTEGKTSPIQPYRGVLRALQWTHVATFALGAAVLIGAVMVARTGAEQPTGPGFTQLWMLPSGQTINGAVRLGIANQERSQTVYRLRLQSGEIMIREWPEIRLDVNGRWESTVELPQVPLKQPVEALLYQQQAPDAVYRRVTLWPQATP